MSGTAKPVYRYWPGVGMVRVNNARKTDETWCRHGRQFQHEWQRAPLDSRFQVCRLCGWQRRKPITTAESE